MKEDLKELAELQKSLKVEIEEPKFDMMSILNDVNLDLLEQEMREDIKNQCAMLNIHPGKQARSAFFSSRIQRSIQYLDKRQNENLSPILSFYKWLKEKYRKRKSFKIKNPVFSKPLST